MNINFIAVNPDLKLSELIRDYFNVYWKSAFPVINDDKQLVGMITTDAISKKNRIEYENKKVSEMMIPVSDLIVMSSDKEFQFDTCISFRWWTNVKSWINKMEK